MREKPGTFNQDHNRENKAMENQAKSTVNAKRTISAKLGRYSTAEIVIYPVMIYTILEHMKYMEKNHVQRMTLEKCGDTSVRFFEDGEEVLCKDLVIYVGQTWVSFEKTAKPNGGPPSVVTPKFSARLTRDAFRTLYVQNHIDVSIV